MSKKTKELSGFSKDELIKKADELRRELVKLKSQSKTTGMKNPTQIRDTKRAIARALTLAKAKEVVNE